jgi:hypothetical protein
MAMRFLCSISASIFLEIYQDDFRVSPLLQLSPKCGIVVMEITKP